MALILRIGSHLTRAAKRGDGPLDTTSIVERIVRGKDGVLRIEARTERQRCFDRALTGTTTWTEQELRTALTAGTLTITA